MDKGSLFEPLVQQNDHNNKHGLFPGLEEEEEEEEEEEFLQETVDNAASESAQDELETMTYGRRLALYLMKFNWYKPTTVSIDSKNNKEDEPSLEEAWFYFEHFTLRRALFNRKINQDQYFKQKGKKRYLFPAERGEMNKPTRLYPLWNTKFDRFGDFGIGIGLYFSLIRFFIYITLIAGLLSIPNILYFSSDSYSDSQPGIPWILKGSAICTREEFVFCPTCEFDVFQKELVPSRFSSGITTNNSSNVGSFTKTNFAVKNDCDPTMAQGMVSLAVNVFLFISVLIFLPYYEKKKAVLFDENEQTAADYSITISNPPSDAKDPEEWKKYFEDNFDVEVICCTLLLDNDVLLRTLVKRREVFHEIELQLAPGTSMDSLGEIVEDMRQNRELGFFKKYILHPLGLFLEVPELYPQLVRLDKEICSLCKKDYGVTQVFLTFNTQSQKQSILTDFHDKNNISPDLARDLGFLFRDEVRLDVSEVEEPNSVRWQDLNTSYTEKTLRVIGTSILCIIIIAVTSTIVVYIHSIEPKLTPILISIFNSLSDQISDLLTKLELHPFEGQMQTSLLLKAASFQWVNTAVLINLITPFAFQLTFGHEHLIYLVYKVVLIDALFLFLYQVADPLSNFNRHFLAPRASSQEKMNEQMKGTPYTLAHKYATLSKVIFTTLHYGAMCPSLFFVSTFILILNYSADKFSLLRSWAYSPQVGSDVSRVFIRIILVVSLGGSCLLSSYFWAGYSYDNLCAVGPASSAFFGNYTLIENNRSVDIFETNENDDDITKDLIKWVEIDSNSTEYKFCLQDLGRKPKFPPFPKYQYDESSDYSGEWMSPQQEKVCLIWGWASVFFLVVILLKFIMTYIMEHFFPTSLDFTRDIGITFEDVVKSKEDFRVSQFHARDESESDEFINGSTLMSAFIPQVHSSMFSFPLIACNSSDVKNDNLYDWKDPSFDRKYYDLTEDAKRILLSSDLNVDVTKGILFDKFKHW